MSEEILRALMELFAIIIKQDGGMSKEEKAYVENFLNQQIGVESAEKYIQYFLEQAEAATADEAEEKKKLTSVLDSVKTLKIGKKISKTIDQRQKVVVLVRCVELINTTGKLTEQRLSMVKTIADVFRIDKDEHASIVEFVTKSPGDLKTDRILLLKGEVQSGHENRSMTVAGLDRELIVLRIPSVELYFIRYMGDLDVHLNGHPIKKETIYLLANGSSIRFPIGLPVYYSDLASHFLKSEDVPDIRFMAKEIGYTFPGGTTGLEDISFSASHGNLIGIMGSSGSGKTTLLNVLSGMLAPGKGSIDINGKDLHNDDEALRGIMGHVPQDDLLVEELTVFDNLYFNARFCFRELSDKEIREKVYEVLETLGLLEKKDLKVGSVLNKTISGGQRKRLNIALELIREPAILFLDEPTSGLSSRDSENVMDLLRELTIRGKLIFVVIHQPSSELFKMFDRVIVLDEGGKMVYYGNPVEAVIHFKRLDNQVNYGIGECPVCGNVNPEQIFHILEARQVDEFGNYTSRRKISPLKWKEFFDRDRHIEEKPAPDKSPPASLNTPNWFGQFLNYLRRDFKSKISNRQYLTLVLGVSPLLAIILSYIIRYIADPTSNTYIFRENENIPIYIFMAIIVALFLGLIMSAEEIFRDRKILRRERFLHLSRSSYLVAKILNIFLMSAIQTIIFVLIANPVLGMNEMIFHYWLALFSIAACANLIGLIISSAFNSAVTIYILVPLVMIPMMVLSGAMFSFEKLNRSITSVNKVPLIADAMPTKWAYEALMVRQFKDNRFESTFFMNDMEISRTNFKSAYYIPELEDRLSMVKEEFSETGKVEENASALDVLRNEIMREQDSLETAPFEPSMFEPEKFNEAFSSEISLFLSELNTFYMRKYLLANRLKQNRLNQIMKDRREMYYSMLDKYHNESVADRVKKIYEKNKIIESDGRLYQQTDPIFLLPERTRSHLYAPMKIFFGRYYDTYWFNILFIWGISIILYLILYLDLLQRVINAPLFNPGKRVK
jgi:ABC-type multidrug transport system ATPase subunit